MPLKSSKQPKVPGLDKRGYTFLGLTQLKYTPAVGDQSYKEQIINHFKPVDLTTRKIDGEVKKFFPEYSSTTANRDAQQRRERAALSLRAKERVADLVLDEIKFDYTTQNQPTELQHNFHKDSHLPQLGRPWCNFLQHGDSPEAVQFNNQLISLVNGNDPTALGNFLFDEIEKCRTAIGINDPADIDRFLNLSDAQLLDQYPSIYRYSKLMGDIESLSERPEVTFNETQRSELNRFKTSAQDLHYIVTTRIDIIANPYYELYDPAFFYDQSLATVNLKIDQSLNNLGVENGNNSLTSYFNSLYAHNHQHFSGSLERLTAQNPALKDAVLGYSATYSNEKDALVMGQPVVARTKNDGIKVIIAGKTEKVLSSQEYLSQLSEKVEASDKHLLTGSRQFANMQKALKTLSDFCRDHPNASPKDLQTHTVALQTAATEYLRYKKIEAPYSPIEITLQGKNSREQSRLNIASTILSFADAQQKTLQKVMDKEKDLSIIDQKVAEATSRLNRYVSGEIHAKDKVIAGSNRPYMQHVKTDLAMISFKQAIDTSNSMAEDGIGPYQKAIETQGYDQAFKLFVSSDRVLGNNLARSGLNTYQVEDVKNFLNQNGPTKLTLNLMKENPLQKNSEKIMSQSRILDKSKEKGIVKK